MKIRSLIVSTKLNVVNTKYKVNYISDQDMQLISMILRKV